MELDNATNNLDNVEQIDSELSALASLDSDIDTEEQLDTEMQEVIQIKVKYDGSATNSVIVEVDNKNNIISATLQPVQYDSKDDFPEVGSDKLLYIDLSNTSIWFFDSKTNTYKQAVNTEGLATEEFVAGLLSDYVTNDRIEKDYASKDYVEKNGGKIDTISVNGTPQEITNKNVNIDLSKYAESKDLTDIADDLGKEIDDTNSRFDDYAKLEANQTFVGSQTFVGNITIKGDIIQNGDQYITQAEKVETENDYIVMRKGAKGALGERYSGFEIVNYDGANNARLVVDGAGMARVGDVGDEQPLLTREESEDLTDGEVLVWNAKTNRAEGSSGFAKTTDLDEYVKNVAKERVLYGTTDGKANTTYQLDYSNTAQVNRIPFRALNGAIMITDKSCEDGQSGAITDGLQAVNKNFVKNNFVKKEEGKGLSSNDFTQAYIDKISELENSFPTVTRLV